ncbi:MAG: hypothetical protein HOM55_05660 [Proteobacteria bacterium]|jgi:hypothetical protein|nr:hypothetical protein [Pseudomonadota bacterium]
MAICCLQSPGFAQNNAPLSANNNAQPGTDNQVIPTPEPHRGYLIELIVFKNNQYDELANTDNNDYSLPNARPTNRTIIYPAASDELHTQLEALELNLLYEPIAYTAWRQISKPRSGSPRFQLNEIAPGLTGTLMIYDNVILLAELDLEYNPALGTAATRTNILDIPAPDTPTSIRGSLTDESSIFDETYAIEETFPVDETLTLEHVPYTGEYYPQPYSSTEGYIFRRVNHDSARHTINEKRRIKFEETHYFDHPAFGVLLRAIRTEIPVNEYNLSDIESRGIPAFSTTESVPINLPVPNSFIQSN